MKKKILGLAMTVFLTSCVSDYDRVLDCKKKYPNGIVTPSSSLIARQGYELTVEDTLSNQIYAVSYYPFSATKINSVMNIR